MLVETAIQSPIRFRRQNHDEAEPTRIDREVFDTVGINFEGRLVVWHAPEVEDHPTLGHTEYGMTVSMTVLDTEDVMNASSELERFLSAVAFYYAQPVESVAHGSRSSDDPYIRPMTRPIRTRAGIVVTEPCESMAMRPEPEIALALAHYREGVNASSPFYRFLALWNALDAIFKVGTAKDAFLDFNLPGYKNRWDPSLPFAFPASAKDLERNYRHAIAHVYREAGRLTINPDSSSDRVQLDWVSSILLFVAADAIRATHPDPISVG